MSVMHTSPADTAQLDNVQSCSAATLTPEVAPPDRATSPFVIRGWLNDSQYEAVVEALRIERLLDGSAGLQPTALRNARSRWSSPEHRDGGVFNLMQLDPVEPLPLPPLAPAWLVRGLNAEQKMHRVAINKRGWASPYHKHGHVMHYHAAGDKVWWLRPPGAAPPSLPYGARSLQRLCHADSYNRTDLCRVRANDLLFVPDDWWHATCSLGTPTIGYVWALPDEQSRLLPQALGAAAPDRWPQSLRGSREGGGAAGERDDSDSERIRMEL